MCLHVMAMSRALRWMRFITQTYIHRSYKCLEFKIKCLSPYIQAALVLQKGMQTLWLRNAVILLMGDLRPGIRVSKLLGSRA